MGCRRTWTNLKVRPHPQKSCAISGGATALLFLGALRNANVDWKRITLFWTDERAVAPDDPESNYGIAERMLLGPLGAKAPRAIRMPADMPRLGEAALRYDNILAHELHDGPLDLALLGSAKTATSLRSSPAIARCWTMTCESWQWRTRPSRRRVGLSLTLPFLRQTKKIWIIAIGPRKLAVLKAAHGANAARHAARSADATGERRDGLHRPSAFTDRRVHSGTKVPALHPLEFFDQRRPLQRQQASRGALVVPGPRQRALDQVLLDLRDERRQIDALGRKIQSGRDDFGDGLNIRRQIAHLDLRAAAEQGQRALDGVLELSHVAGPRERHQSSHRFLCDLNLLDHADSGGL